MKDTKSRVVNIIGGGLAGTECAWILAENGIKVKIYEMKPIKKSSAHTSDSLGELVCSNSLKSEAITNACGLLKKEMSMLGSLFVEAGYFAKIPAGQALAVDRDKFSEYITRKIANHENVEVIYKEITDISYLKGIVVIATGPLTSDELSKNISKLLGNEALYFYDAAAPIILADSLDMSKVYRMDRYGEVGTGDYLNCAMNKEQYTQFYNSLINAESADRHEFDKLEYFEGCMPIEELARRGEKTLIFGPMKPVGLNREEGNLDIPKPYAVLQLRSENEDRTMYNMVGFQTSMKFSEQDRIFKMIPGLENSEFVRYGVMHRNTYINGPRVLDSCFRLKETPGDDIYFAGQISGVEGYVESAASGLMVAYNIITKEVSGGSIKWPEETILGSLAKHISTENKDYQPMNANFGIILPLEKKIKDKKEKYLKYSQRSIEKMEDLKNELDKLRK